MTHLEISLKIVHQHAASVVADGHPLGLNIDLYDCSWPGRRIFVLKAIRHILPHHGVFVAKKLGTLQEIAANVACDL